ncbi:fungal-specific transcription factor domain-containing protein [Exophiala viscosa]|uniref:Fungal-specific transcription factor domain-containing protein n=1 Tax=Exophiala viscosa TaxID=2486360 RepID=A0AAN6IA47_9EURO|nr:fungal-specific transcription factor domain-containing protein [Exophiala viscosa]
MRRPSCTLCSRVGSQCVFPTKRKRPERIHDTNLRPRKKHITAHLKDLPADAVERLMVLTNTDLHNLSIGPFSSQSPPEDLQSAPEPCSGGEIVNVLHLTNDKHHPDSFHQGLLDAQTGIQELMPWEFQIGISPMIPDNYFHDGNFSADDLSYLNDKSPSPPIGLEAVPSRQSGSRHGENSGSPPSSALFTTNQSATVNTETKRYQLIVPDLLLKELVDIFFDKVASFLPIFHRPRFYHQYLPDDIEEEITCRRVTLESALILNGVMSLSARFSRSPQFEHMPPTTRGDQFAKQAQSIYADATRFQGDEAPSLRYLQGCILLAFYHNTNHSNSFGWTLTGVCTRLAYDLGLNTVDDDVDYQSGSCSPQWTSTEDWIMREELRRAWWSVWELDTFASTVARRSYTIDRNTIQVLLPASDEHWFEGTPVASAPMGSTPATAWKSLQGSPNQDERAWFLVANYLMALAYDLMTRKDVCTRTKAEMENSLTCFGLSLPQHFRLTNPRFVFNDASFARSNWIIATNVILQSARTYGALTLCAPSDGASPASQSPSSIRSIPEDQDTSSLKCVQHAHDVVRAINAWSPDYMEYTSPFIVCSLVGPAAMHFSPLLPSSPGESTQAHSLEREVVTLGIAQFARVWGLGYLMLDLTHALHKLTGDSTFPLTPAERDLAVRYTTIAPAVGSKFRLKSLPT